MATKAVTVEEVQDGEQSVLVRQEDADFRTVANPSNNLIFALDSSRGEKLHAIAQTVQANEYGLPLYYIRGDMIDWNRVDNYGRITYDEIEAAAEMLDYSNGFPLLRRGSPFWNQLPHEPHDAYLLFQQFLELDEQEGIRLLESLAVRQQLPLENIREMSLEYLWSSRARSYDLFIVAAEAKKREVRTRKTENEHFNVAGGILDTIIKRFNDDPDLLGKLDASELISAFEQMVKIQRLSLGLTGAQSSTNTQLPMNPGSTVEVILRQLTKDVGLNDNAGESMQKRLTMLMGNENDAMKIQELIVRATTSNQVMETPSGT